MPPKEESDTAVMEPPPAPPAEPPPQAKPARPKVDPRNKPRRQPPYAVIVENDDHHTYPYVMIALCKVCGHSPLKAFKLAQQIDRTGRAIVWTGTMELAELKRDQIKGMGPDFFAEKPVTWPLGVTLEPMPD